MIEINMVQGDTAPNRQFTVTRDGVVVDISNATIKLIIVDTSTGLVTNEDHQNATIIEPASNGTVQYDFQAGDLTSPSVHFGDLQVIYEDSEIETNYDRVMIHVRPKVTTVS